MKSGIIGLSAVTRISFSLSLLALSIVLTGDLLFGLKSKSNEVYLESRRLISEAMAVQFSSLVSVGEIETVEMTMRNLVLREKDVLSVALRTRDGRIQVVHNPPFDETFNPFR